MIRPPGFAGAAFGTTASGDLRNDTARRTAISNELGIAADWAFAKQVHGAAVVRAMAPGTVGEADAIVTTCPGIPIAVATADCVPVIVEAANAVAVVHAGWRGAAAGVVPAALQHLVELGHEPQRAAIGPAIGPCCYEVGHEVLSRFPGHVGKTSWGTASVDIPGFVHRQLAGLEVWKSAECTYTSQRLHSWRRDGTRQRQVAVAWLPNN
jgi:hypothetical protein